MIADKRSVSTDALAVLGTIIDETVGRDAIHLAVEPVIAGERLLPGQHIGVKDGKAYNNLDKYNAHCEKHVGIVDPFLSSPVDIGQRFLLIVYPRQITSLRHVWSHPDFEEEVKEQSVDKAKSEQWLRDWCANTEDAPDYDDLIAVMTDGQVSQSEYYGDRWSNEGEYLLVKGSDAHGEIPNEVFDHIEIVTGHKIIERPTHFSCSC